MHTATQLALSDFEIKARGETREALSFLTWGRRSRLGVIMDRPFGALGASLLIQLCTAAFFARLPERRNLPLYADIFLFHVGQRWGNFGIFDFWPERREPLLPKNPAAVLAALNDYGITHLLVPDGAMGPASFGFKDPESAHDRLRRCWAYAPGGDVDAADIEIKAVTPAPLENPRLTLDPEPLFSAAPDPNLMGQAGYEADFWRFIERLHERRDEAKPSEHALGGRDFHAEVNSGVIERYRTETGAWALGRLGRLGD